MATTARHGSGICTVYGCTSGPVAGGFCGEHALVGLSTGGPLNEDEMVERHDVLLIFRSRGGTRTKPRTCYVAQETGVILRTGYRTLDEARAFCEGYDMGLNDPDGADVMTEQDRQPTREEFQAVLKDRDGYYRRLMVSEHLLREQVFDLHDHGCSCEVCEFIRAGSKVQVPSRTDARKADRTIAQADDAYLDGYRKGWADGNLVAIEAIRDHLMLPVANACEKCGHGPVKWECLCHCHFMGPEPDRRDLREAEIVIRAALEGHYQWRTRADEWLYRVTPHHIEEEPKA